MRQLPRFIRLSADSWTAPAYNVSTADFYTALAARELADVEREELAHEGHAVLDAEYDAIVRRA